MRKTDKKIDNQLREVLTEVCETALKKFSGFQWLTHLVSYSNFPQSLTIVCIFDTNESLDQFKAINGRNELTTLIQNKLLGLGVRIPVKSMSNHIDYDTEEDCNNKHSGNWAIRLGSK